MAVLYLPSDYRQRTHSVEVGRAKTGQVSKRGLVVQTEHWDGSMDAVVKPAAFGMGIRPLVNDAGQARALAELADAIREYEVARLGRDAGWVQRAASRVDRAREQLQAKAG